MNNNSLSKLGWFLAIWILLSPPVLSAPFATIDSDGDGVLDIDDVDDDNDGIIDYGNVPNPECRISFVPNNITGSTFNNTQSVLFRPSDFGIALGGTNQSVTRDFSSLYGLPLGSIVVTVTNAHHILSVPGTTTNDRFSIDESLNPTVVEVSGTYPVALQVEQGQEFRNAVTLGTSTNAPANVTISKTIKLNNAGLPYVTDNGSSDAEASTSIANNGTDTFTIQRAADNDYDGINGGSLLSRVLPPAYENKSVEFSIQDNDPNNDSFITNNDGVYLKATTFYFRIMPVCDYDRDGLPNSVDLDSDNDNCLDALEGSGGNMPADDNTVASELVTAGGSVATRSQAPNQTLCAAANCAQAIPDAFPGAVLSPTPTTDPLGQYWYQERGISQDESQQTAVCFARITHSPESIPTTSFWGLLLMLTGLGVLVSRIRHRD